MKEIDARGQSCPQPVLLVKKAVDGENPESLVVLLTGETSKGNVTRFAESRVTASRRHGRATPIE